MKTDCQSYGQSYYTNSVDPLKKKKKNQQIKTTVNDSKGIRVSTSVWEYMTKKSLLFSDDVKINSIRVKNKWVVLVPTPTRKWSVIISLPYMPGKVIRMGKQLSERTPQRTSQPRRMERKGTELTIHSKIQGSYWIPEVSQRDIQWKNYVSNYSQLWL